MNDTVIHGDALSVLRGMADNSVDAICTDPPAGINFMNKPFDDDRGGRDQWVAWLKEIMIESKRVLKPGGHALIWALPRTSHWTATALEDAGFEVRDKLYHLFGSGFPKSHNISVAIDKHLKVEREVIGVKPAKHSMGRMQESAKEQGARQYKKGLSEQLNVEKYGGIPETKPATPEAAQYAGYGTALKPSCEEWILVRKPLAESSIAAQVLATGTGGINIGATRISHNEPQKTTERTAPRYSGNTMNNGVRGGIQSTVASANPQGRFPSHLLLSHSLWCVPRGTKRVPNGRWGKNKPIVHGGADPQSMPIAFGYDKQGVVTQGHADSDGMETVEAYDCAPDCPIAELDRQSGVRKSGLKTANHADNHNGMFSLPSGNACYSEQTGGSSRYFQHFPPDDYTPFLYQSKASRAERNKGCEDLPQQRVARMGHGNDEPDGRTQSFISQPQSNTHPTVKSTSLMRWLIRLITPPDGIVLDPFCGSGSTCVAAIQEGKHFIGIEQDESYVNIANARIAHAQREQGVTVQAQEYDCAPDCPVRILGEQSGVTTHKRNGHRKGGIWASDGNGGDISAPGDTGTAARYFQQFAPDLWTQDMQDAEDVFIAEGGYEGEVPA